MPTANYVTIDGVAYSQFHPKVKAMKQSSAGGKHHSTQRPKEGDAGLAEDAGLSESSSASPAARAFVSTDEKKLNKTEKRFLEHLRGLSDEQVLDFIGIQAITFKLADDTRYTPDFVVHGVCSQRWIAYEVKGFWRDDAKVKIKVAARMFPMRFVIVQLVKGQWQFSEVKP